MKTTTIRCVLYLYIIPDLLKLSCSYLHPKFYEFLYDEHDKLTHVDKIYFINEYLYFQFVKDIWESLSSIEKQIMCNKLFVLAINKKRFSVIQYLINNKVKIPYTALMLAKKLDNSLYIYMNHHYHLTNKSQFLYNTPQRKAERFFYRKKR